MEHDNTDRKEHSLEERIVKQLKDRGLTVTTAESCTGGLLAGRIINVSGASDVYREGYITYSDDAKKKLIHVSAQTLEQFGAVSGQTAKEMALGAAEAAGAGAALSTTGIAGPGGGTKDKPVGLVYTGCCLNGTVTAERHVFAGERAQVRNMAVEAALQLLERCLLEE